MIAAGMIVTGLLLSAWLGLVGAAVLALTGSKEPRRKRRGFKRLKKPIWVAGIEPATQIAHSSPPQAAGHPERFRELMDRDSTLLLAVAVNLLAALILRGVIRRRSHHLRFPANTRSLQPAVSNRAIAL